MPVDYDLIAEHVDVRDVEVVIAVTDDRAPQEDVVVTEDLAEYVGTFLLNGHAVGESKAGLQHVAGLQVVVDDLTLNVLTVVLAIMKPEAHVGEVIFRGTRVLEFGMQQDTLLPVGVREGDTAVDADNGVDGGFGLFRRTLGF